MHLRNWRSQRL